MAGVVKFSMIWGRFKCIYSGQDSLEFLVEAVFSTDDLMETAFCFFFFLQIRLSPPIDFKLLLYFLLKNFHCVLFPIMEFFVV